jgi:hypothetical protein
MTDYAQLTVGHLKQALINAPDDAILTMQFDGSQRAPVVCVAIQEGEVFLMDQGAVGDEMHYLRYNLYDSWHKRRSQ